MGSNVSLNLALSSVGVTTTISVSGCWMLPVVATDGGSLSSSIYNTRTDHSVVGRNGYGGRALLTLFILPEDDPDRMRRRYTGGCENPPNQGREKRKIYALTYVENTMELYNNYNNYRRFVLRWLHNDSNARTHARTVIAIGTSAMVIVVIGRRNQHRFKNERPEIELRRAYIYDRDYPLSCPSCSITSTRSIVRAAVDCLSIITICYHVSAVSTKRVSVAAAAAGRWYGHQHMRQLRVIVVPT